MGHYRAVLAREVGEAEVAVYHVILLCHQAASSLDHARPGLGLAPCEHLLIVLGALQAEGRGRNLLTLPEIRFYVWLNCCVDIYLLTILLSHLTGAMRQ